MGFSCTHTKITHVLTIGNCEVHAGSLPQIERDGHEYDLVVSLTGHPTRKPVKFRLTKGSLRLMSHLNDYMKRRQHNLVIDWPDMQAPELDLSFWQALYADLENMKGRAVIHCMGGHGRTGTALAVLKWLQSGEQDGDPVTWVRKNYCQEAVETESQIRYLRNVIGVITSATHSNDYRHSKGSQSTNPLNSSQRLFPKGETKLIRFPETDETNFDF